MSKDILTPFFKKKLEEILSESGIKINGNNPWDIKVLNNAFYKKVLLSGTLGLGESYMDGFWECKKIDEMIYRALQSKTDQNIKNNIPTLALALMSKAFNLQSLKKAFKVGKIHYDLSSDFYASMLDKRMNYSCGFWPNAKNLDEAQKNKLNLICRKLYLKPGMKILDIGCGWGGFAKFAAKNYGTTVVGITISKEQAQFARNNCRNLPVTIKLGDYRELNEKFDRIASIGMFEHVGPKNYRTYMQTASMCLKDDGLFLLHTIGGNKSTFYTDPWLDKYIFPGGILPSIKQIGQSVENLFIMEDWHNFGLDYDKTLMAWYKNVETNWPKYEKEFGDKFYRMWKYYLLTCAGGFRAKNNQLWQIVLSKRSNSQYKPIRY